MPHWEDDADFDLERHVRRVTLSAAGDDEALQDYVNTCIGTPLLRDRPLWEIHLIDGYGSGSAIYSRLHHALADGIALMQVLLSLTDDESDMTSDHWQSIGPAADESGSGGIVAGAFRLVASTGSAILDLPHLVDPSLATNAVASLARTAGVAAKLHADPERRHGSGGDAGTPQARHVGTPDPAPRRRDGRAPHRDDRQRRTRRRTRRCRVDVPPGARR